MASGPKLVVVGDGAVGKTCLLMVYAKNEFPVDYVPTVFENYKCKVTVGGVEYPVQMWDTAGQEELENIRTLSYANTNVYLLAYSVADRTSYDNIPTKWMSEIKTFGGCPKPNILLVGTKTDLRKEAGASALSYEDGEALARQIGAFKYMECSAMKNEGVKDVFDAAIVYAVSHPLDSEGGCCNVQ